MSDSEERPKEDEKLTIAVLQYLRQKGFKQAESALKSESKLTKRDINQTQPQELSIPDLLFNTSNALPVSYLNMYSDTREWINSSMHLYKYDLRRALFPLFVHSYFNLIQENHPQLAHQFMESFKSDHLEQHKNDLLKMSSTITPIHLAENDFAQTFKKNKYSIKMSRYSFELLLSFLQNNSFLLLLRILNEHISINVTTEKPKSDDISAKDKVEEGNIEMLSFQQPDLDQLRLGRLPPDAWLTKELERVIREGGIDTHGLSQDLEKMKKDVVADSPSRDDIPLPPPKLVDVVAEIHALKEARRYLLRASNKIPTICSYTLHNTYDSLTTARLSPDASLLSAGFSNSCVKIWNVKGSVQPNSPYYRPCDPDKPTKLIGHSGPVYATSFSPDNKYLVSCSEDKTVRLWSLQTNLNLACYKSHNYPVWDCDFGPNGVYFATASYDRTARLWSCDHIFPLRLFVGHLSDVDCVRFHPNNNYLLTGSSDMTARLWDVQSGRSVRLLQRHQGPVYTVAISPDGKFAASAGDDRNILLWDLGMGKLIKKMKGHESTIENLMFSNDGKCLVSCAMDWTVRTWDCAAGSDESIGDTSDSTGDLLNTFYTKRTNVCSVQYSKSNLLFTVGVFKPLLK